MAKADSNFRVTFTDTSHSDQPDKSKILYSVDVANIPDRCQAIQFAISLHQASNVTHVIQVVDSSSGQVQISFILD